MVRTCPSELPWKPPQYLVFFIICQLLTSHGFIQNLSFHGGSICSPHLHRIAWDDKIILAHTAKKEEKPSGHHSKEIFLDQCSTPLSSLVCTHHPPSSSRSATVKVISLMHYLQCTTYYNNQVFSLTIVLDVTCQTPGVCTFVYSTGVYSSLTNEELKSQPDMFTLK